MFATWFQEGDSCAPRSYQGTEVTMSSYNFVKVIISPSICSKAPGRSSVEGLNFSQLAPTELKTCFSRCTHRLLNSRHLFWSLVNDFCKSKLFWTSASNFALSFCFSCSKLSDWVRSFVFNSAILASASANKPLVVWSSKSFFSRAVDWSFILLSKLSIITSCFLSSKSCGYQPGALLFGGVDDEKLGCVWDHTRAKVIGTLSKSIGFPKHETDISRYRRQHIVGRLFYSNFKVNNFSLTFIGFNNEDVL